MKLYFVRDSETGYIKIGVSKDPQERLKQHRSRSVIFPRGNREMELIGVFDDGSFDLENWLLQTRFKHLQIRGEWLNHAPELYDFIRTGKL